MMAKVPNKYLTNGQRTVLKSEKGPILFGVDMQDAREELFVRMVTDGLALGVAFIRAGFKSASPVAASNLWQLPRIQERAAAIMEARRTTGVVTLPEVTAMLQRVYSGAIGDAEYSAAHNAAFSLARLYGHVTDKASVEVVRRPSRDPDAPSEMALSSWVDSLPGDFSRIEDSASANAAPKSALASAPASLLGIPEPSLDVQQPLPVIQRPPLDVEPLASENANDFNGLDWTGTGVGGRPENGAPSLPVTGTPNAGAQSELLASGGPGYTPGKEKAGPSPPETGTGYPKWEDLF